MRGCARKGWNKMRYALDKRETVRLNGWNHALCYRAAEENLPLMLFLHGGPGAPDRHLVLGCQSALAKHYTLVCWDQRGAGLSFAPTLAEKEPMTLPQVLEDVAGKGISSRYRSADT